MTQITPPLLVTLLVLFLGACQAPQQPPAENKAPQAASQPSEVASSQPEGPSSPGQDPTQIPGPNAKRESQPPSASPKDNTPAESPNLSKPPAEKGQTIVGKWQFKFPPEALEEMKKANMEPPVSIFTFTSNGKWTLVTTTKTEKRSLSGTYAVNGNQVTLTLKEADGNPVEDPRVQPLVVTLSQDGNSFTTPAWEGGYFARISGKA